METYSKIISKAIVTVLIWRVLEGEKVGWPVKISSLLACTEWSIALKCTLSTYFTEKQKGGWVELESQKSMKEKALLISAYIKVLYSGFFFLINIAEWHYVFMLWAFIINKTALLFPLPTNDLKYLEGQKNFS